MRALFEQPLIVGDAAFAGVMLGLIGGIASQLVVLLLRIDLARVQKPDQPRSVSSRAARRNSRKVVNASTSRSPCRVRIPVRSLGIRPA